MSNQGIVLSPHKKALCTLSVRLSTILVLPRKGEVKAPRVMQGPSSLNLSVGNKGLACSMGEICGSGPLQQPRLWCALVMVSACLCHRRWAAFSPNEKQRLFATPPSSAGAPSDGCQQETVFFALNRNKSLCPIPACGCVRQ